jgi:hypothetical protein
MSVFRHSRELQSEFLEIVPDSVVRIRHVNLPHFERSISLESSAAGTLVSWVGVFENRAEAMNTLASAGHRLSMNKEDKAALAYASAWIRRSSEPAVITHRQLGPER